MERRNNRLKTAALLDRFGKYITFSPMKGSENFIYNRRKYFKDLQNLFTRMGNFSAPVS